MDTSSRRRIPSKLVPAAGLAAAAIILAIAVMLTTRPGETPEIKPGADSHKFREAQTFAPPKAEAFLDPRGQVDQLQPNLQNSWEERLDTILTSDESNTESVRRLLKDFDRLPSEAQSEYMAHALNLCEDESFSLIQSIYLESTTPSEVQEQIFDELLNRPDDLKLPLLANTMSIPNHSMQEEAREILCLYLEVDPEWTGQVDWTERVRVYLKENGAGE